MSAEVSDADLEKIRVANEKLRQQIADADSLRAEREKDQAREIEYTNLQAENVRLTARLAQSKDAGKVGTVKDGAGSLLAQAKDQLKAAEMAAEAGSPLVPVDTNAENPPKGTTGITTAVEEKSSGSTTAAPAVAPSVVPANATPAGGNN